MIIQTSTAYSAQKALSLAANSGPGRQVNSSDAATMSDKVTISQAGRDRLSASPATPSGEYPLEYYAMPQWLAGLFPTELSGKLGARADDMYVKGGHLIGRYDAERYEYGKRLDSHLQAAMKKEGVDSLPEYHEAMTVDKAASERLRQQLRESLAGDPKMMELMGVLGMSLPR
ncbi:MAG: hypothetical protein H6R10_2606 [Rhodocyclaceae bacterium]|nr:hypothetical protein [Rhodocyclaceae bacterium]